MPLVLFYVAWVTRGGSNIAYDPLVSPCASMSCVSCIREVSNLPVTIGQIVAFRILRLRKSSTFMVNMRSRLSPSHILMEILMFVFQFCILLRNFMYCRGIFCLLIAFDVDCKAFYVLSVVVFCAISFPCYEGFFAPFELRFFTPSDSLVVGCREGVVSATVLSLWLTMRISGGGWGC